MLCIAIVVSLSLGYGYIVWQIWQRLVNRAAIQPTGDTEELCFICFAQRPDVTMLPCGHRGQCHMCAQRLLSIDRRCPMCRASVVGVLLLMV